MSARSTLALGREDSQFYRSIRSVLFAFGRLTFIDERGVGPSAVIERFRRGEFEQVLMPNPYGNPARLRVYRDLRAQGARVIASDRGALPDTWFFDGGFNADSESYRPERWDTPLAEREQTDVRRYLQGLRAGRRALEDQGARRGGAQLRRELRLEGRRVLFVPLQRPGDTVVRHFSGPVDGMCGFQTLVREVAARLSGSGEPSWAVVYKKHPLEREARLGDGVQRAPDDAHIHDLLELADATLVLNSGVGVLSLAFGTPTMHVGEVFYGAPGLSRRTVDAASVADQLANELQPPSPEKVERFIHHLTRRVYSFVDARTEMMHESSGSRRRVTRSLRFRTLNVLAEPVEVTPPRVLVLSPLSSWPSTRGSQTRMDTMIRALIDAGASVDLAVLEPTETAPAQVENSLRRRYPEASHVLVHPHPHARRRAAWRRWAHRALDVVTGELHQIANRSTCPPSFRRAVGRLCAESPPDYVLVNYAKLTPALPRGLEAIRVIDTHDHQTALLREDKTKNRIRRWVDAEKFSKSEARALSHFERIIAIGSSEARSFAEMCPDAEVHCIPAFTPAMSGAAREADIDLLFVGSISNFNVKGLAWFVDRVLPLVRLELPSLELTVVGRVAAARELNLARPGVRVRGVVADIDDIYARSRIVIAPLLGGAGMKIKVVEALAHAKPLVCTHHAAEGIELTHQISAWLADDPDEFARGIVALSRDAELRGRIAEAGRAVHAEHHSPGAATRRVGAVFRLGPV